MKVTVDLSESELEEVCFLTGEAKKGPAIRRLVQDALMLKRREQIAQKYISGEWGVELTTYEEGRSLDKATAEARNRAGRD